MEMERDSLAESIAEEKSGETGGESAVDEAEEEGAEGAETEEESEAEGESAGESEGEEAEASGEDEEGPDEKEEPEEGEEEDEGRVRNRGRSRIQRQQDEILRLRAENDAYKRGHGGGGQAGGEGGTRPAQPQGKTPQQIRADIKAEAAKRLEGLEFKTPDERADAVMGVVESVVSTVLTGAIRPLQFATWESNDRSTFRDRYGQNPLYKRLSGKVEERFIQAKNAGYPIPRETIFKDLIGDDTLRQLSTGSGKQRREAMSRKAKAKGAVTKGKGDTTGKGGGKSRIQTLEERLEGKPI